MFPAQAQAEVRIAEMQPKMPIEEVQERFGPHCLSSCPRAFCPYAATQLGRQEAAPRRGLFTFRRCLEEEGGELSSKSINLLRARVERERESAPAEFWQKKTATAAAAAEEENEKRKTEPVRKLGEGIAAAAETGRAKRAESILLRKATRSLNAVRSPTAVFMLSRRAADSGTWTRESGTLHPY